MTDTKMRTLDTIQLNRQKLNFQSHPKPKKQFVCLYGRINNNINLLYHFECISYIHVIIIITQGAAT